MIEISFKRANAIQLVCLKCGSGKVMTYIDGKYNKENRGIDVRIRYKCLNCGNYSKNINANLHPRTKGDVEKFDKIETNEIIKEKCIGEDNALQE